MDPRSFRLKGCHSGAVRPSRDCEMGTFWSFRVLCGSGYQLAVRRRWRESLSRVDQRGCRRGIFEGITQVSKAISPKKSRW